MTIPIFIRPIAEAPAAGSWKGQLEKMENTSSSVRDHHDNMHFPTSSTDDFISPSCQGFKGSFFGLPERSTLDQFRSGLGSEGRRIIPKSSVRPISVNI
jgi:hypothetical protein